MKNFKNIVLIFIFLALAVFALVPHEKNVFADDDEEDQCEISSWSCSSCLDGPVTAGDACYGDKWTYCSSVYDCDFTGESNSWRCPMTCSDDSPTPTPTPTEDPSQTPTPTVAPTIPPAGHGDGLHTAGDGRSDGLCSKPPCVSGGQVLRASTEPAVLGLSTTSGEESAILQLIQPLGALVLSIAGFTLFKRSN